MRQLVVKFVRYFHLYTKLMKASLMEILIYRPNALIMGFAPIIWTVFTIFSLRVIYSRVSAIVGWSFYDMILLVGVNEVLFLLTWLTFVRNLRRFINDIRTGYLDFFLLKPANPRFLISFNRMDITTLSSLVNAVFILSFALRKLALHLSLIQGFNFLVLLVCAYLITYCLYFIVASLSLWTVRGETFIDWLFEATEFGRYPEDIYKGWMKKILLFVIPLLFFAYVPAAALLGRITFRYTALALFLVAFLFFISEVVWRAGLRQYQSVSS
jgi:ABC-2 type transport system permease protein